MAHRFEITKELEVGATPEQVWEAPGPGWTRGSWVGARLSLARVAGPGGASGATPKSPR